MPKVACPHCSARLDVRPVLVGRTIRCTRCEQSFRIDGAGPKVEPTPPGPFRLPQQRVDNPVPPSDTGSSADADFEPLLETTQTTLTPTPVPRPTSRRTAGASSSPSNRRLKGCIDCGERVSRRASICPHCGASQRISIDPFALAAFALSIAAWAFMSPVLAPMAAAACFALWLVGLVRAIEERRAGALILSAITFLALATFVWNQVERERETHSRLESPGALR